MLGDGSQHRGPCRLQVIGFFETAVAFAGPQGEMRRRGNAPLREEAKAALLGVLSQHGAQLVHALVVAIAGVLPPSRTRFLSPVLKALATTDAASCQAWTVRAVQALPPAAALDGQTMVTTIFTQEALGDDRAFFQAVDAFSTACRRKRVM